MFPVWARFWWEAGQPEQPCNVIPYCRLGFICDGICLRIFVNVRSRKKYDRKKFQCLYSDYTCDEFSPKFFNCQNFYIKVSWHFCKCFSAQNDSSLQYMRLLTGKNTCIMVICSDLGLPELKVTSKDGQLQL